MMNKIENIDKIFIIHHTPLQNRKNRLQEILDKLQLDVEWVESFLPEDVDYDKETFDCGNFVDIEIVHPYGRYRNFSKKISISELSLYLKHKECIIKQIKNNYENIIIFEDDVNLDLNLIKFLNNNLNEFQHKVKFDGANLLMLGTAFNFKSTILNGDFIHFNEKQLTRCAHAYVVNINCAQKILDKLYPINLPWDFKLNEIIITENLNVYWSEPGLTQFSLTQGTTVKK